ncbi:hypothetical protein ACYOEI_15575 [Singulisphaera rosea]
MSVRDDIKFTWTRDNATISAQRTIITDAGGALDLGVPNGSQNLPAAFSIILAVVKSIFLVCDQAVTLKAGGRNAVQTLSISGTPTGGNIAATFGGQTATIPYNSTAAQVQTLLRALSSIGSTGVVCTGGPLPATPVVITFAGTLGVQPVATITKVDSLTGGTSPASTFTATTAGANPDTTLNVKANVPLAWDSQGYFAQPFASDVSQISLTNSSGVDSTLKIRTASSAS